MITILIDHNIEGQSKLLWDALVKSGWVELLDLKMVTFKELGLAIESDDRLIWRFAQANSMILLTHNRNKDGNDSLEQTMTEEVTLTSLPVLTIGKSGRVFERTYRARCVERLLEIIMDLNNYLGAGRIFIP